MAPSSLTCGALYVLDHFGSFKRQSDFAYTAGLILRQRHRFYSLLMSASVSSERFEDLADENDSALPAENGHFWTATGQGRSSIS